MYVHSLYNQSMMSESQLVLDLCMKSFFLDFTPLASPLSSQTCFYKMGKKGELSVGPQNTSVCKLCRRPWERVVVMPSSRLCWNFGDFDVIPVAPLPRAKTMSQYSTFRYCINDNHYRFVG